MTSPWLFDPKMALKEI